MEKEKEKEMADDSSATCVGILVAILVAILLPPLGVFLKYGCKAEFWICLSLTLFGYLLGIVLGYLPGILYALYVINRKP